MVATTTKRKRKQSMSNYLLPRMDERTNVISTAAHPLTWYGTVQCEEMSLCFIVVIVSAVSAGINIGNPGILTWETTYDDGLTWDPIIGINTDPIISAGKFFAEFTFNVQHVGPDVRVTVTPPAGETITISEVRKARSTEPCIFRAPVAGGGGAGEDTISVIGTAQLVLPGNYTSSMNVAYVMCWDGTVMRQLSCDTSGNLQISVASNSKPINIRNRYTVTPVTTAAYVELLSGAANTVNIRDWQVWDSSGQAMVIAKGAVGSEVPFAYVPPGGLYQFTMSIPSGTRISAKALSGNAVSGELIINGWGI
jgi:hypothetical protein